MNEKNYKSNEENKIEETEDQKVIRKTMKVYSNVKNIDMSSVRDIVEDIYSEETGEWPCDPDRFGSIMNIVQTLFLYEGKTVCVQDKRMKLEKSTLKNIDDEGNIKETEDYTKKLTEALKYLNLNNLNDFDYNDEKINFIDITTIMYTISYMNATLTAKFTFYGEDEEEYEEFDPYLSWESLYSQEWTDPNSRYNEIIGVLYSISGEDLLPEYIGCMDEEDIGSIDEFPLMDSMIEENPDDFDEIYTIQIDEVTIEKKLI